MKFIYWLKSRLNERSTWLAISAGVAGAAALTAPFSWIAMVVGVIGALLPDGNVTTPVEPSA